MNKSVFIFCVHFLSIYFSCCNLASGQTKRGLLIGINEYVPKIVDRGCNIKIWTDLDGCVNDVFLMKALLISRYGFKDNDIKVDTNGQAKKGKIISDLEELARISRPGDIVFFFFSGHGSQVKNSLSSERIKEKNSLQRDEAIVPSDAWNLCIQRMHHPKIHPYLRDKEINVLLNNICDKGAILTAVFDCCHSRTMTRGLNDAGSYKSKYLPLDSIDVKDPTIAVSLADKGALILNAARENEPARECISDFGVHHGAFTLALTKAMMEQPVFETPESILTSIRQYFGSRGLPQVPSIEVKEERTRKNLIGEDAEIAKRLVIQVKDTFGDTVITIDGGWAHGLTRGTVLSRYDYNDSIIITEVLSLSQSRARVMRDNGHGIKREDLLKIVAPAPPDVPFLIVYAPPADYRYDELAGFAETIRKWATHNKYLWVQDPSDIDPSHTIYYTHEGWKLNDAAVPETEYLLGKKPDLRKLKKIIGEKEKVSLFLYLPPCRELAHYMQNNNENGTVQNAEPDRASYFLVGRYFDRHLSYSWMIPGTNRNDTTWQSTLPIATDWVMLKPSHSDSAAAILTNYSYRLGRISGWLNLENPPGSAEFPFILGLQNNKTRKIQTEFGSFDLEFLKSEAKEFVPSLNQSNSIIVHENDTLKFLLLTDWQKYVRLDSINKHLYIFSIDKNGTSKFLLSCDGPKSFPVKHKFPPIEKVHSYYALPRSFRIKCDPCGKETIFLLTSNEELKNFKRIIECEGVRTRGLVPTSPLEKLLESKQLKTRGGTTAVPSTWNLHKISVDCKRGSGNE